MASKPKAVDKEAASEAAEGADGAAPAKKKLPLKLIIIAVGGLAVVGGGGFFAYKTFFGNHEVKVAAPVVKPAAFLDLPEILVNLSNVGSDRTQYLKVKMTLELADQTVVPLVQPMLPRVTDTFQTYLRELRSSDLDGSAGLYRLREELTKRVNATISPQHVNAVLFKEIVVQ